MALKPNDLAAQLAAETKKAIAASKVETVAELKGNLKSLLEEHLGSETAAFKALSEALTKDVLQRIPQQSLFTADKGKGYDPELGLKSLGKERLDEMAQQILFMVTPAAMRGEMFEGKSAKAMGVGVGASGGFTLPEEFVAEVARKLVHTSVFASMCRMWPGVDMIGKMPKETGTVSVYIAGELVTPTKTDPALGQITWALQKRMLLTNLPKELWRFSGIDILSLLSTMFAEQAQKTIDYYFLLGSGSQQPMGLLTQTTGMNAVTMGGSSLVWQDLLSLKHGIKSQYRLEKGNCAFMTNDATIQMIAKLTDDQNRPVFLDRGSMGLGGPDVPPQTIGFVAGQPVLENPYTPGPVAEKLNDATLQSVATTASIVFANFKRAYYGFTGPTAEIQTSDQAYDAFLNEGIYAKYVDYFDGKPAIAEAAAYMTGVK